MELTVTRVIKINIDEIIDDFALSKFFDYQEVEDAVSAYVACMDDFDFYSITDKMKEQICQEVVNELHRRTLK